METMAQVAARQARDKTDKITLVQTLLTALGAYPAGMGYRLESLHTADLNTLINALNERKTS